MENAAVLIWCSSTRAGPNFHKEVALQKVLSKDGTAIACHLSGNGPPLVLVHGTGGTYSRWAPVLPALEKNFTVYAIERRGRGESSDAADYAIEREFEDVAAVVDAVEEPVNLLGHSYGGICALEAALLTGNIRNLVLYEPPIPIGDAPIYPEGLIDRLQGLLDSGNREGVLETFMGEVVKMNAQEIELTKSMPAWPSRVAAAHTLPRELRAHETYRFIARRYRSLATPARLLVGSDSPYFFRAAIDLLAIVLPAARTVVLEGQQHIAMESAPDLFARVVSDFLMNPDA
jgi:pimeloyl-ACP methyl ester carboxylesterase